MYPCSIRHAIHLPPFSAAAELRTLNVFTAYCPLFVPHRASFFSYVLNTSSPPDSVGYPRMTTFKEGLVRLDRGPQCRSGHA